MSDFVLDGTKKVKWQNLSTNGSVGVLRTSLDGDIIANDEERRIMKQRLFNVSMGKNSCLKSKISVCLQNGEVSQVEVSVKSMAGYSLFFGLPVPLLATSMTGKGWGDCGNLILMSSEPLSGH